MTFLEAKSELKKLANRKYHSISYELTETSGGQLRSKCQLYIDPQISSSGATWEEALNKMKVNLGISAEIDLSEAPEEEKKEE